MGIKKRLSNSLEESVLIKKRLTEKRNLLEKIEEKYVIGELKKDLYEKYCLKYQNEIALLESECRINSFSSSNLEKIVEKGIFKLTANLNQIREVLNAVGGMSTIDITDNFIFVKHSRRRTSIEVCGVYCSVFFQNVNTIFISCT